MFGLIKKYDVHMCSEVKGVITLNVNPVEGVLINRSLKFAHKIEKEDQITIGLVVNSVFGSQYNTLIVGSVSFKR